jgi:hypothetical protein
VTTKYAKDPKRIKIATQSLDPMQAEEARSRRRQPPPTKKTPDVTLSWRRPIAHWLLEESK